MTSPNLSKNTWLAAQDFQRARRQATLREIVSRFTGKSIGLLSYEEVRQRLKAHGGISRGLQDIPLDAIVGSVGRYNDFTRDFLPLADESQDRWVRINIATNDPAGVPPIEVYQIGEAYFVLDGNHRVSVARQLGSTHIQAYVTEVKSKVPLTPDVSPDDLIIKAEYIDFLEQTRLDVLRPGMEISVSIPGQYRVLLEHIQVHRYFMGIDENREVSWPEAVQHWYDTLYLPVIQVVREHGILQDFPGRTEADLYLWVSEHRAALERELGWWIRPEAAASDLAAQFSPRPERVVARLGGKIIEAFIPDELESGPPPGEWRRMKTAGAEGNPLLMDLLVPVGGDQAGWNALVQAIMVAKKEGSLLHGLHVVPSEAERTSPEARAVQAEFERRCGEAGVAGELAIASGSILRQITSRSRWVDLVVVNLAYPPPPRPILRLSSGFRNLIRRCPRPLLAAPGLTTPLENALLAYDGSPKAQEALFVATYLALRWNIPLTVVTVIERDSDGEALERARAYLEERGVQAAYVVERGEMARAVLKTARKASCDFIIMGGYGASPVVEAVIGSSVDQVLRKSRTPMLICR